MKANIHYSNNFSVCTPDNFAVKQRIKRTKNVLRTNLKEHRVRRNERAAKLSLRYDSLYSYCGALFGVGFVSTLLSLPIV